MTAIPRNPSTDFSSTTLNGNINDSVGTITVINAGTIQTPTYAVIDRLDINSVLTPNLREVIYISSKSGNDLTVTRGVNNSTARSHNSGAILEPVLSVGMWADLYSAYDLDHTVGDGSHDITRVAMLSGATVQTLANKILSNPTITAASLTSVYVDRINLTTSLHASGASVVGLFPSGASGGVLTSIGNSAVPVFAPLTSSLSSKIISGTRDLTAATGDVAYTGVGFTPTVVIAFYAINGAATAKGAGYVDSAKNMGAVLQIDGSNNWFVPTTYFIASLSGSSDYQKATLSTFDADGVTLSWTKTGSPTGTLTFTLLCLR